MIAHGDPIRCDPTSAAEELLLPTADATEVLLLWNRGTE
jgi:hypothetical protein